MKIGNLEVYGVIYKITNILNNKVYIGQTINGFNKRYHYSGEDIERYYKLNKYYKNNNKHFNRHLLFSIEKYGFESFQVNKIFDIAFSKEELDIKEDLWISYFDCINNGYNNQTGGGTGIPSEETREKLRKSHLGSIPWNKGKTNVFSKETLKKMSEASSNENNYFYGVRKYGKDNPNSVRVICLNTNKEFDSALESERYYNITGVILCCQRKRNYAGILVDGTRLVWEYYNDYLNMNKEQINKRIYDSENSRCRENNAFYGKTHNEETKNIMSKNHYNCSGSNNPASKSIICITNGEVFLTIKSASIKYFNKKSSGISNCCSGRRNYCGKLPDGTKLQWKNISDLTSEEYILYNIENKLKELSNEENNRTQDDSSFFNK